MKHKLLQVMAEREDWRVLDGRIEVDDAYLGGERPGKRGRGSENKVSFLVAVQTADDGRPMLVRMNRITFTNDAIEAWANKALAASARVIADSLNCFTGFRDNVADYQAIVVGSGRQSVVTHPEFRRVNTVLSNLKTAISGYLSSFQFRQVCRPLSGRSAVPFQSSLRSQVHPGPTRPCRRTHPPTTRAHDQTG
jgi:hypothetical protein